MSNKGRVRSSLCPQIETLPLSKISPSKQNSRTHSKKQVGQVAESIRKFGFINPILVDQNHTIVAGHARFEAAKVLGMEAVPVLSVTGLSDTEIRAYMIADNKLALNAGWDRELLATEFAELQLALPEIGLDFTITGFGPGELDALMADFGEPDASLDEIPEINEVPTSRAGDLFTLGKHRVVVGDSRDAQTYSLLMRSEQADMCFLDPPYNVRVDGHVGGRGATKHREFAFASGEMTSSQFTQFLQDTLSLSMEHLIDGGISYICMDWRHSPELFTAGAAVFDELKNICVWTKTNPGQGSFYRSQHEFVFVYKKGTAPHINTFELGQHGRSRSNVWSYAGVNSFRAGRMDELRMHPTVKPVPMIADAMKDCSHRGSIILDSFCGSGSTIAAAEQVGRRAYCIEIDARYVDVSIQRWQRMTGKDALLEATGQTFEELHVARIAQEKLASVASGERTKGARRAKKTT